MKRNRMTSLILTLINAHYGISKKRYQYFVQRKRLWELFLFIGVVVLVLVTVGPLFIKLQGLMIDEYRQIGFEGLFLTNAIMLTGMFGFFLGIFLVINEFFYNKNLSLLISLPLKPKQILLSKVILIIIDQLWISLVFLLPSLIIFGIKTNGDILYWICMFFILLCSQLFPVIIQIVVILPLSKFINFGKHKDFFVYFLSIALLVAVIGFQFYINQDIASSEFSEEKIMEILANPQSLVSQLGRGYPPALIGVKALIGNGFSRFLWLLLFIGIHITGLYIALEVGEKTYYETWLKLQDHYGGKKKDDIDISLYRTSARKGVFASLIQREWRYFLRVPAFAFNGFANVLIVPVLLIVFYLSRGNPEFKMLFDLLESQKTLFVPIGILFGTLVGSMNMLASTLFSREGRMISELKALPVDSENIFKAKLAHVMLMSSLGPLSTSIVLCLMFNMSFFDGFLTFMIAELLTLFLNLGQICLDCAFPSLNWDNPQKAMKQNINGLYTILLVFGFTGILGYTGYLLRETWSGNLMTFGLFLIGAMGTIITYPMAKQSVNKILSKD